MIDVEDGPDALRTFRLVSNLFVAGIVIAGRRTQTAHNGSAITR